MKRDEKPDQEPTEDERWTTKNKDEQYPAYRSQWFTLTGLDVAWLRGAFKPDPPKPPTVVVQDGRRDPTQPSLAAQADPTEPSYPAASLTVPVQRLPIGKGILAATLALLVIGLVLLVRMHPAKPDTHPVVSASASSVATTASSTVSSVAVAPAVVMAPSAASTVSAPTITPSAATPSAMSVPIGPLPTVKKSQVKGSPTPSGREPIGENPNL